MNKLKINTDFETDFSYIFNKLYKHDKKIIIMCIGTDRIIGDSFGPLVGYNLKKYNINNIYIEGDIRNVICANNILKEKNRIYEEYKNPFIICVDSCLSSVYKEKTIIVEEHGTIPGAGLGKNIQRIGNMSVKGVVSSYAKNRLNALLNVRLNMVIDMADTVANGIKKSLYNI